MDGGMDCSVSAFSYVTVDIKTGYSRQEVLVLPKAAVGGAHFNKFRNFFITKLKLYN